MKKVLMYVGMPFLILSSTLKLSFTPELIKMLLIVAVIGIVFSFRSVNKQGKGWLNERNDEILLVFFQITVF